MMQIIHNFDYNPSRQKSRPDIVMLQNHIKNRLREKTKRSLLFSPSTAPGCKQTHQLSPWLKQGSKKTI